MTECNTYKAGFPHVNKVSADADLGPFGVRIHHAFWWGYKFLSSWQRHLKYFMQTSTSTTSALRRWSRHFLCQRLQQARYASRNAETYALHSSRPFVGPKPTFESIGIRAPIASAMRAAFPDIQYPTKAQNDFIPAVLSGRDVLLKDDTGTGKYVNLPQVRVIWFIHVSQDLSESSLHC